MDKVLMANNNWVMTEAHIEEIAAAGFNVVSPRRGNDDADEVRRIAQLAQTHGIRHLPWMRGTLLVPEDLPADSDRRLVWADGTQQDLYSPNADELWEWLSARILPYARLSIEAPALMGVFLDFENYAPRSQSNAYPLSYDTPILEQFARQHGIKLPVLERQERKRWLEDNGHHEAFSTFQVTSWRKRCRQLRQAVDEINPRFQFCIYPAPGTFFMEQAVWPEWSSTQAPLILADKTTYGRPAGLVPHSEALVANRRRIEPRPQRVNIEDFRYLGGINPTITGADAEFSGKNAVMLADATDGYWVFYEGLEYDGEHPDYFRWFSWANEAIATGRFEAQDEPRQTAEPWDAVEVQSKTARPQVAVYGLKPRMMKLLKNESRYELHELSGLSPEYLRHLDVVVLQNFNVGLEFDHEWVQSLRDFVMAGGGLMVTHDTGWFMASPFPEVAVRDVPTQRVESVRHVVDTDLQVVLAHPALGGLQEETRFTTEFRDHMVFRAGHRGKVMIENVFGDPVYVVGEIGEGRVVYSGSYYGYTNPLAAAERQAFLGCLNWLAR
ncbi:MAG: hypothetical protein HOH74_04675 [Gemmatimonadetes bacterium]|nr:hypothetical protein [Gemmatimonadota bacterium]